MVRLTRRDFLKGAALAPLLYFQNSKGNSIHPVERTQSAPEYPSYLRLYRENELQKRAEELKKIYQSCTLCPRDCRVDRTKGELGKCRASERVKISSAFPHFGEESPLVGTGGSGTIFFSNCSLRCIYCQNYDISINGYGQEISDAELGAAMVGVQKMGCHNINLVTPTHYVASIVNALLFAIPAGLKIPLVYNTGGYDKVETLRLLDGIVDIYMPDFKYWEPEKAGKYSAEAYKYPHYAREAHREMQRQVGVLRVDGRGVAVRGLIIRHLVLPNRIAGTRGVLRFIAEELSKDSYVNVMRQYRPEHEAPKYKELNRRITGKEFAEAMAWAREFGLHRFAA
ncbi:MAG: radical SAM protein [Acidobacteriota bacterium]